MLLYYFQNIKATRFPVFAPVSQTVHKTIQERSKGVRLICCEDETSLFSCCCGLNELLMVVYFTDYSKIGHFLLFEKLFVGCRSPPSKFDPLG